jgi:hypothetical protein
MSYTKPEITNIASAVHAIENLTEKPDCTHLDSTPKPITLSAYEADE